MHHKQNNKESKTYVQGLRPFGTTLPRGLKGILKKNGYNYSEIISKWNVLVGSEIADCAYPKSVKMKKGNTNVQFQFKDVSELAANTTILKMLVTPPGTILFLKCLGISALAITLKKKPFTLLGSLL